MKLPQLPADKANHYLYGSLIAAAAALAAPLAGIDPRLAAIGAAAGLGVLKEVLDRASGKGTPDLLDAVATAAGGVVVGVVA